MPNLVSWLRLLAGVAVLLATRWASAASASATGEDANDAMLVTTRAASHEGTVSEKRIAWHTTLLDNRVAGEAGRGPLVVKLARPLAKGAALVSSNPPGARAAYGDDGAIVAFVIDAAALERSAAPWPTKIVLDTTQPIDPSDAVLVPPMALGETPQVITVSGDDGSRFDPDPALNLVRHIGFLAADDVDPEARRTCADLTGARGLPLDAEPIYVRGTSFIVPRIHGRITTSDARNRGGLIAAALAFLVCGVGLALLYRRLTSSAQVERADVELRAEFEDAGRDHGRS